MHILYIVLASVAAGFAGGIFFNHHWTGKALAAADKAYADMQKYYVGVYSELKAEVETLRAKVAKL